MSEKDIVFLNERNSVFSNSETMTVENAKSLFCCPWRRDTAGYVVLRSVRELEVKRDAVYQRVRFERQPPRPVSLSTPGEAVLDGWDRAPLRAGRAPNYVNRATGGWPRHWPEGVVERFINAGDEVLFPQSVEADNYDVLDDRRVLTDFLNCGVDSGSILEFTNRYGLLWTDRPVTLEDFRFCKESLREVTASGETSPGTLANLEKFAPTATMHWVDGEPGSKAAPQFVLPNLWAAICYQLGQSFASNEFEWRVCRYCPRLFTAGPGGDRKSSAKSCCEDCTIAYQNRKNNENRAEKTRQARKAIPKRKCRRCGEHFSPTPKVPEYCRKPACLRQHYRTNQKARAASA